MKRTPVAKVNNTFFYEGDAAKGEYFMVGYEETPYDYFAMLDYILDEAISASSFTWNEVIILTKGKSQREITSFILSLLKEADITIADELNNDLATRLIFRIQRETERETELLDNFPHQIRLRKIDK